MEKKKLPLISIGLLVAGIIIGSVIGSFLFTPASNEGCATMSDINRFSVDVPETGAGLDLDFACYSELQRLGHHGYWLCIPEGGMKITDGLRETCACYPMTDVIDQSFIGKNPVKLL